MKKKIKYFLTTLFVLTLMFTITACKNKKENEEEKPKEEEVKIVEAETKKIEYEEYNNGLVKIMIPRGWKVDIPPVDYIHYSFKVYNPEKPEYSYMFGLKMEGFLKSKKARDTYKKLYPNAMFSKLPYISPQTTEAFFKVFSEAAKLSNKEEMKKEYFPILDEFSVIENMGKSPLGGDILRATFKDKDGKEMQGVFTAQVYSAGSYNMYGADLAPLNVYHTIMMMTPEADLNEWLDIMEYSLSTLEFTESFVNKFNTQEAQLVSTVLANQKIYDSIGDMIMDSWEKRNNSYDIISQKRSDATLGYERVYNTETGDVYRAYNGFTDNYHGSKYQTVTDDMYTTKISGYIEK